MTNFKHIKDKQVLTDQIKAQENVCAELVKQFVNIVFNDFEKQTGLKAINHLRDIAKTSPCCHIFSSFSEGYANIDFLLVSAGWFRKPLYLKGSVAVYENADYFSLYIAGDESKELTKEHLLKLSQYLSKCIAEYKS